MYPAEETPPASGTRCRMCLLDSSVNTTKASPLAPPRKERPARVKHGAALEHGGFFWFSFLTFFHLPPSLFNHVSVTSFHDIRMVALAHQAPCASGARMQGEWEGYSEQIPGWSDREPWKPPRRPDVSVWSRLVRNDGGSHTRTPHSHTCTHPHTGTHTGNGWFVTTHCSIQSLHSASYI